MKRYFGIIICLTLFIACNSTQKNTDKTKINTQTEPSNNENSNAGGPPTLKQLLGVWKLKKLPNEQMNKVNPWPLPFQWFYFNESGKVYSMMKTEDEEYTAKELIEIFELFPAEKIPNYKLSGQFITINNPEIENHSELWGGNIFAKDFGLAKKGDLVMTLDDGNGQVIYYRFLEKVE